MSDIRFAPPTRPSGVRRLLGACATVLVLTGGLLAGSGAAQAQDIEQITDDYLFSKTLPEFVDLREDTPHDDQLDWSSDACSQSPDEPLGFDFTPACYRHDFGYRNYSDQGRFTETSRKRIDDKFYADLKNICSGNTACNGTAWIYYQAVRKFGNS